MIENPARYEAAKQANIRRNAATTRRRALERAIANDSQLFKDFIFGNLPADIEAMGQSAQEAFDVEGESENANRLHAEYQKAMKLHYETVGHLPQALRDALNQWGGLSEKQLAWARKAFAQNVERNKTRAEETAVKIQNAQPWAEGRQEVTGVVKSVKWVETNAGYGRTGYSLKGIVETADGRRLWVTMPAALQRTVTELSSELKGREVTMTVTVTVAADDKTMGFGKRPTMKVEK